MPVLPAVRGRRSATQVAERRSPTGKVKVEYHVVAFLDRASTNDYSLARGQRPVRRARHRRARRLQEVPRPAVREPARGGQRRPRRRPAGRLGGAGGRRRGGRHARCIEDRQYEQWVDNATDQMSEGRRHRHADGVFIDGKMQPDPGTAVERRACQRSSEPRDLTDFIAGLPKAELHVHHVGSASPRIVAELAERAPGQGAERPRGAARVLRVPRLRALRRGLPRGRRPDPRARGHPAADLRGRARDGRGPEDPVRRARPARRGPRPMRTPASPIEAYIEAIEDARVAAERDFGIVLRWIYDIPGESGLPAADETLGFALDHRVDALVGFGLGGPGDRGDAATVQAALRRGPRGRAAQRAARRRDHRSGDRLGRAARLLGAERIGHGTSSAQDPALLEHLAEHGIPLEVCPSSNVATRAVAWLEEHPLAAVRRRRGDRHGQLRRPADVRHHPQPGVRDRRRAARTSTRRASPTWRGPPSARRSRPTTSSRGCWRRSTVLTESLPWKKLVSMEEIIPLR